MTSFQRALDAFLRISPAGSPLAPEWFDVLEELFRPAAGTPLGCEALRRLETMQEVASAREAPEAKMLPVPEDVRLLMSPVPTSSSAIGAMEAATPHVVQGNSQGVSTITRHNNSPVADSQGAEDADQKAVCQIGTGDCVPTLLVLECCRDRQALCASCFRRVSRCPFCRDQTTYAAQRRVLFGDVPLGGGDMKEEVKQVVVRTNDPIVAALQAQAALRCHQCQCLQDPIGLFAGGWCVQCLARINHGSREQRASYRAAQRDTPISGAGDGAFSVALPSETKHELPAKAFYRAAQGSQGVKRKRAEEAPISGAADGGAGGASSAPFSSEEERPAKRPRVSEAAPGGSEHPLHQLRWTEPDTPPPSAGSPGLGLTPAVNASAAAVVAAAVASAGKGLAPEAALAGTEINPASPNVAVACSSMLNSNEVGEQKLPALAVLTQEQELAAHPVTRPDPSQDEALRVILHDLDKASSSDTPLEVVAPYLRFHGVVRASFQLADYRFGKAMAKCKEQLEPGRNWKDWLQAAVTVSYKTVLRAIRLYHFCQRFPGAIAIDRVKSFCVTKLQCDRLAAAIDALEVKGPWAQPPSWFRK